MMHNKKQVMQDNIDVLNNATLSIHSNDTEISSIYSKKILLETSLKVLVPSMIRDGVEAHVGFGVRPYIDYTIGYHLEGLLINANFLDYPILLTKKNTISITFALKE